MIDWDLAWSKACAKYDTGSVETFTREIMEAEVERQVSELMKSEYLRGFRDCREMAAKVADEGYSGIDGEGPWASTDTPYDQTIAEAIRAIEPWE